MSFKKSRKIKLLFACVLSVALIFQGAFVLFDTVYGADEQTADDLGYVDNQLIVTFKEDVSNKEAADIVAFAVSEELVKDNANVVGSSLAKIKKETSLKKIKSDENTMLVKLDGSLEEVSIAKEIARNPDVERAQPNYRYKAGADSSNIKAGGAPGEKDDWYLDYIDAPEAWKLIEEQGKKTDDNTDLKPVTVAVIGVGNETALIKEVAGKNQSDILSLLTIEAAATTEDLIESIDFARNHNAKIILLASGRHGYDGALERKVNKVAEDGVLFIAPAGDEGSDVAWYPSDFENCMGCINTNKYTDAFSMACKNDAASYGENKNLSAPGTDIKIQYEDGGEVTETGSICSAAIVAGTAAMVMYVEPEMKADQVKDVLEKSANDICVSGYDVYTANGMVDAYKALTLATGQKAKEDKVTLGKANAKAKAETGHILISWSAIKGASNYVIYRKGPSDEDYVQVASVNEEETSWSDSSCIVGKEYSFKVMAAATSKDGKKIRGELSEAVSAKIGQ